MVYFHPFGKFSIAKKPLTSKFIVFGENSEIVVDCQTEKQAKKMCDYLNALIEGRAKVPRKY